MDLEPSINSFKFLPSEFVFSQLGVWSMFINSRHISNLLGIGWGQKSDCGIDLIWSWVRRHQMLFPVTLHLSVQTLELILSSTRLHWQAGTC